MVGTFHRLAQCHDHKFDPITQKEYYQLFAFLNNQDEPTMKVYDPDVNVDELAAEFKDLKDKLATSLKEHAEDLVKWEDGLTPQIKKSFTPEVNQILASPRDNAVLISGDALRERRRRGGAVPTVERPLHRTR